MNKPEPMYQQFSKNNDTLPPETSTEQGYGFAQIMHGISTPVASEKHDAPDEAPTETHSKSRRIAELRTDITQLRTQLVNSGYSKKIQNELSLAQHELYWLLIEF